LKPFVLLDKRFYPILKEIVKFRAKADDVNWSNIPAEKKEGFTSNEQTSSVSNKKRHLKELIPKHLTHDYGYFLGRKLS